MRSIHRFLASVVLLMCVVVVSACSTASDNPDIGNVALPLPTKALATLENNAAPTSTRVTRTPTRAAAQGKYKTLSRSDLPPEAIKTLNLIQKGGPFPYRQDGQVFQNREGLLPKKIAGVLSRIHGCDTRLG